jgi:hypothetical protein
VNETLKTPEPRAGREPGATAGGTHAAVLRDSRFRVGALLAVILIVGIILWLVLSGSDSSTSNAPAGVEISPSGLTSLAGALRQPIYWVGPAANVTYELARPGGGRILLSYVPASKSGDKSPRVTVGTYQMANAYAVTQGAARKAGTVKIDVGGGAIAFYNKAYPLSAFVSYPGSNFQIEVFDPKPGEARRLVASGEVKPVPGSPPESGGAVAVSAAGLAKRSASEHQPIYWAGPAPRDTLELTKTSDRWFLLRYLPPGVPVGASKAFLTVGTYPVTDAFAAVQRLAAAKGATKIDLPNGGLAVVNPNRFPYSVFLAYPGSNYQVEVFAPSLSRAKRLVTSGKISATG